VEVVDRLKYLGSLVEARGRVVGEVDCRIVQASRVFCSLRDSVFTASNLTLENKRMVYRSVMLGVLLYGAEPWAPTPRTLLVSWIGSTDVVFVQS